MQINDSHDHSHHNHPNLVEGDRLQFTSEGKGGVAPLFIRILDALDENADDDDKDDDDNDNGDILADHDDNDNACDQYGAYCSSQVRERGNRTTFFSNTCYF